jgi:gliding motility-associated lipoprotein GldH
MLKYLIPSLIFVLLFASCDKERIYDQTVIIPDEIWLSENRLAFDVNIEDSLMPCNFYINLRHRNEYAYRNIFFFIDTDFPDGQRRRDTLECILQDKDGRWYGNGTGNIQDHQILFQKGHRFPLRGKYIFTLEQAMRESALKNIVGVGLRIERSNP